MRDLISNTQRVHLGSLTMSGTGTLLSGYVDTLGFDGATIELVCNVVTDAGAAGGFTATLQESADTAGASATTVAAGETVGGVNTIAVTSDDADHSIAGAIGYRGGKRYLGLTITGTTGSNAVVTVMATLGKPHRAPTTYVGTKVART